MKNAFIRSRRDAAALADDRQASPNEYAGDKVEYAADELTNDTENVAVSGTKSAVRQGRKLFQRQREKKAEEKRKEGADSPEQTPSLDDCPDMDSEGQLSRQNTDAVPDGQHPPQSTINVPDELPPPQSIKNIHDERLPQQHNDKAPEGRLPRKRTDATPDVERPMRNQGAAVRKRPAVQADMEHTADTADTVMERGRAFVKRQAAKWAERKQQTKSQPVQSVRPAQPQGKAPDVSSALPKQAETAVRQAVQVTEKPMVTVRQSTRTVSQAPRSAVKAADRAAKGTVKSVQRTVKTARYTTKVTVKTAQHTSKVAIKTTENTAKAAQKTAQATAKAAKMSAQAARATAKTAAAAAKASAKAIAAAVKATIASVKSLAAAIAAGGGIAVLVIVIVCLIGLIVGSCFGIFFAGDSGGTGYTMSAVVREINLEYENNLEEIKTGSTYDVLEMTGSDAVWLDVLAVYAVRITTDPTNPQEVATMDNSKKALLKEIFWAMHEISSYTSTETVTQTVEVDDGEGGTIEEEVEVEVTTLYITVTHKTADEMADTYSFTADQRQQLAELLAKENRDMWNSVLDGIGLSDGRS